MVFHSLLVFSKPRAYTVDFHTTGTRVLGLLAAFLTRILCENDMPELVTPVGFRGLGFRRIHNCTLDDAKLQVDLCMLNLTTCYMAGALSFLCSDPQTLNGRFHSLYPSPSNPTCNVYTYIYICRSLAVSSLSPFSLSLSFFFFCSLSLSLSIFLSLHIILVVGFRV